MTAGPPGRWAGASRHDERGFVGGFEGLLFGVLVFVLGTLVVADAWAVVDGTFAADAAARQAVRTFVEAPDAAAAPSAAAAAAAEALAGYGRSANGATVAVVGGVWARCSRVTIAVTLPVPLVVVPGIGGFGPAVTVTARQSELVDPLRSGLPGQSSCF